MNVNVTRSHFSQSPRHIFFCSSEATSRGLPAGSAKSPSGIAEPTPSPPDAGQAIQNNPLLPDPTGRISANAKNRHRSPPPPALQRPSMGPSTSHRPGDGRRIRRQHMYGKHLPSVCQPTTAADARLPPPTPGLLEPTNSSCSNSNNLPSKPGGRYANNSGVLASK